MKFLIEVNMSLIWLNEINQENVLSLTQISLLFIKFIFSKK